MIKPEGIPKFIGDLTAVSKAASDMSAVGEEIVNIARGLETTFRNGMTAHYDNGPEKDRLVDAMLPVKNEGELFGPELGKVASALNTFVSEVQGNVNKLNGVRGRADAFIRKVGNTPEDEIDDNEDWVKEENQLHKDIEDSMNGISEAEHRCANKIAALYGGRKWDEQSGHRDGDPEPQPADEDKEPPWGKPLEYDAPWYEDCVDFVGGVLKGIFVDGLLGTLDALTTLIPIQPLLKSLGVNSIFGHEMAGWDKAGEAWKGVGLTLASAAMYAVPGAAAFMHAVFPETAAYLDNVGLTVLKGMVAWDMWGEDPGRALGQVGFNVITTVGTGGAAGGVRATAMAGKYGAVAAKVAKGADIAVNVTGKVMRPGQAALDLALKLPKVSDLVIKVGNAPVIGSLAKLGGLDIPTAKGGIHLPDAPHVGGADTPNVSVPEHAPVSVGSHSGGDSSPSFTPSHSDSPSTPTGGAGHSDAPAPSRTDTGGGDSTPPAPHGGSDAPASPSHSNDESSPAAPQADASTPGTSHANGQTTPSAHSPDAPSMHSPDAPSMHSPDAPTTHTPDAATPHTPDAPSTHTPDGPSTHTPDGPSTHTPDAPTTHTPDAASTHTPDGPSTHTPDAPSTHTPDAPTTHTPDAPSTHTPAAHDPHTEPSRPDTSQPDSLTREHSPDGGPARTADPVGAPRAADTSPIVPPPVHAGFGHQPRHAGGPEGAARPGSRPGRNEPNGSRDPNQPHDPNDPNDPNSPRPDRPYGSSPSHGDGDDFDWFRRPDQDAPSQPRHDADTDGPARYDDSGVLHEGKNEARWITDKNGRPRTMQATLREVNPGKARHKSEQKAAADRGITGDQGGHGIGHRFFADQRAHQMFPQNKNFNTGAWKRVENEWEAWVKRGHEVDVQVTPLPPGKKRPDNIQVTYTVRDPATGKTVWAGGRNFHNRAGNVHERFPNERVRDFDAPDDDVFAAGRRGDDGGPRDDADGNNRDHGDGYARQSDHQHQPQGEPPARPDFRPQGENQPNAPLVGHNGQDRHLVEPDRYNTYDPDGRLTQNLRNSVGDDPVANVGDWIQHGNPHFHTQEAPVTYNCGDNSRAFADTLQGREPRLANADGRRPPGEYREMHEYTGVRPEPIDVPGHKSAEDYTKGAMDQIRQSLEGKPPGTAAIVGGEWGGPPLTPGGKPPGGGHWFNAFVDKDGVVRWADHQSGKIGDWPPPYGAPFKKLEAVVREPGGNWTSPVAKGHPHDPANWIPPKAPHVPATPHQPTPHQPMPHQPTPNPQAPYRPTPQQPPARPQNFPPRPMQPPTVHHNAQQAPVRPQNVSPRPTEPPTVHHEPQQPAQPHPHEDGLVRHADETSQLLDPEGLTTRPVADGPSRIEQRLDPAQPHPHRDGVTPDAGKVQSRLDPDGTSSRPAADSPSRIERALDPRQPHRPEVPAQSQRPEVPAQPHPHRDGVVPDAGQVRSRLDPDGLSSRPPADSPSRIERALDPHQPQSPAQPHRPEVPAQPHLHRDGVTPDAGEIRIRLDPDGLSNRPAPDGPSRIEQRLDPQHPHPHQDGFVRDSDEVSRMLDPEARTHTDVANQPGRTDGPPAPARSDGPGEGQWRRTDGQHAPDSEPPASYGGPSALGTASLIDRSLEQGLPEDPEAASALKKVIGGPEFSRDVVQSLEDPVRRAGALDIIRDLADGRTLRDQPLPDYLRDHPGNGPLYERIPHHVNRHPDGTTRLQGFVWEAQQHDPARLVGPEPDAAQWQQLGGYAQRLRHEARPVIKAELNQFAPGWPGAEVTVSTKNAEAILAAIRWGAVGRPDFTAADVIDALSVRIVVPDTERLSDAMVQLRHYFGFGDQGRIVAVDNRYAEPAAVDPQSRAVPIIVKVSANGQIYLAELRLVTRRAALVAELRAGVQSGTSGLTEGERARLDRMFDEAVALDQAESLATP